MFKHCTKCKGEFQQWALRCPDCGVALEIASDEAAAGPPAERGLPPASELVCVERGDPWRLHELAEQLQAQGISCRIDPYARPAAARPPRGGASSRDFGLFVLVADLDAAQRVRTEHLKRVVPDAGALTGEPGAPLSDCPACGAALDEGAASCASCGLEFPELGADE